MNRVDMISAILLAIQSPRVIPTADGELTNRCKCGRLLTVDKAGEMEFHEDLAPFTEECG